MDYYKRMQVRQRAQDGTVYDPPDDPDIVQTDVMGTFYNKRTGKYITVPPTKDTMTIMGLIPFLSGVGSDPKPEKK
jgi:hypothetical protein